MEPPSLRLQILQGPREGETLEFRPGSAIRIGRVVRGNTLPIKDSGISSKHLTILTESGKWVLRDLDSSNGTVLDGSKVPPHTPFDINDGSTIKIGELTSILVTFLCDPSPPGPTGPEPVPETEVAPPAAAPVAKPGRGRRGKGLKGMVLDQSIDETASAVNGGDEPGYAGGPVTTRVTRISKNKVGVSDLSVGDLAAPKPVNTRVTRNSKNKRNAIEISDSGAPEEKVEKPKVTRVTRNSKNKRNEVEISDSRIGNLDALEENVEEPKITRVTRNLKNKRKEIETSDSRIGNLDAPAEKVDELENARVTRNSNNEQSVIGECAQNSNLEFGVENVEKEKTSGGSKSGESQEECGGKENANGTEKEKLNGDENLPDLEKLSLGEWFDFLEVHLPKQIVDATEEMFDSMRKKAERLREYITMQKNHQVELPVV